MLACFRPSWSSLNFTAVGSGNNKQLDLLTRQMAEKPDSQDHPLSPCPRCKVKYRLVGIEGTEKPYLDLYTFECPNCGHLETRKVRVQ